MVTFLAHQDRPDIRDIRDMGDDEELDMSPEVQWEQQTLDLIRRLETDKLAKAEQRLIAAERNVALVRQQISTLRGALDIYRAEHSIDEDAADVFDPAELAEYQGMNPREMLLHWSKKHEGTVVMKDAARFLAAAGLFKDHVQAAGTLYPTIKRMLEFGKAGRGVYRYQVSEALPPLRVIEQTTIDLPKPEIEGSKEDDFEEDVPF